MAFEQDAIQYVNSLCINGTFLSGDIVGVNETLENAQAKVTVLKNGEGFEKYILINRIDSIFSWKYLNTITEIAENYVQWSDNRFYTANEKVAYLGKLYVVIQSHQSQPGWTPDAVTALFAPKTVSGIASAWVQPIGATDAYLIGDQVQHGGFTWSTLIAANVWEPGIAGTESLWVKVPNIEVPTGYPAWVQPTGAGDAYDLNEQVSHNGFNWKSLVDANVWEPGGVGTESLWIKL